MAPLLPLLAALIFSLVSPSSAYVASEPLSNTPSLLIQRICNVCSQSTTWNYKFCTDALTSDSSVSTATDLLSMTVALTDLVAANATAARQTMLNVIANGDQLRQGIASLRTCVQLYDTVIVQINEASEELRQRRYVTADGEFLYASYLVNFCGNFLSVSRFGDSRVIMANDLMDFFIYVLDWTVVQVWTELGFEPNSIWKLGPRKSMVSSLGPFN